MISRGTPSCGVGDVNGDGLADLTCNFDNPKAGFRIGDTMGYLRGWTTGGRYMLGEDTVRILPR